MSVGLGLLVRILRDSIPLSSLRERGVEEDLLRGDEVRVFEYTKEHMNEFGSLPSIETIEAETGVTIPDFPEEPFGYWIDRVIRRSQMEILSAAATRILEAVGDGEVVAARDQIRSAYLRLEASSPTDSVRDFCDIAQDVWQAHGVLQRSGEMNGIPFGIEYLDAISNGAQASDTIALVGRPGRGKTYFLLQMANIAHLCGKVPLVVSMEMSNFQCGRRVVALRTHIPATLIRLGRVGYYAATKGIADMRELLAEGVQPFLMMHGSLNTTVEDLVLRVQETRPDVLYVDGAYLLRSKYNINSRWERVSQTAEILKMIATEFGIPVIATYQFNRRGPGDLGHIAFSDAVGQLASIVLGIDEEDDDSPGETSSVSARLYKILELLKGREGERGAIRVLYDMERMVIKQDSVISGYMDMSEGANSGGDLLPES